MSRLKIMDYVVICLFTILLGIDFFSNKYIGDTIPIWLFGVLIIGIFFMLLHKKDTELNSNEILKWQLFIVGYTLFLMGIFSILGGKSSVGISFNNIYFCVALSISIVDIYLQWKKTKK